MLIGKAMMSPELHLFRGQEMRLKGKQAAQVRYHREQAHQVALRHYGLASTDDMVEIHYPNLHR